jgi:hypothetical protein
MTAHRWVKGGHRCFFLRCSFCMALVPLLVLFTGCGRKAPPLPPTGVPPPMVQEIDAQVIDGNLVLTWKSPEPKEGGSRLVEFYVYRSKERLSEGFCEACPVRFAKVAEVYFDALTARFRTHETYSEALEKGYRYQYKVSCSTEDGEEGEASAPVAVDY